MALRHSKKHIKKFYEKVSKLKPNEKIDYKYKYNSDYETFCNLLTFEKNKFTVKSIDWTNRGTETYEYNNLKDFIKLFDISNYHWWRIPFDVLKENEVQNE